MVLRPPFVLLDDARADGRGARLYTDPVEIVVAHRLTEVAPALDRLRSAAAEGLDAAGWLAYEAGAALEPAAPARETEGPLLWFGLFHSHQRLAPDAVPALLPNPAGAWAGRPRPQIDRAAYDAALTRVLSYIEAGDIYQANLTFRAEVPVAGHPAALYALLRARAAAGHGALVATGEHWLLSLSPELFFTLEDGTLTARPMKGTAPRDSDPAVDAALARDLAEDPKQRAENLMIVDLMRNDLGRVATPGSVAVPQLFHVETYPTVHQMTSTITARLNESLGAVDALAALFPCGSVTGAPKIRAMQVIAEVEPDARGVYTGSIGRIDADGGAEFNVAIRTLAIDGAGRASLGLGSGVVADSYADSEWAECRAKGAFVTKDEPGFDLVETMRFDPEEGILLLERHLERIRDSAATFGFPFDRHVVRNELQAATFRLRDAAKVRLLLGPSGAVAIGISPPPAPPPAPVKVRIVPHSVPRDDFRLAHKTTRRALYDEPRRAAGTWEVLFTDAEGYLTEGSFTALFVERDGVLVTPPRSRGLLPGVLRAELLATGRAVEGDLRPEDLANGFLLGNALRGLVAAVTVAEGAEADL
ncbi:para-aminobenzoate synthetase / 4-amino-4-deoxychorismate lyase [Sphingomonas sp. NFR04]|uniref:aminodeoxychorismate synthase component I n=1 Tax=Sphingomonas sp. NFR04 TaxID=1566283 RepID=UPI0008F0F932|nr:aminodeoxychorismate synthase component I [Sphingomonas sp. NFR04]SFJ88004.1 para-aminobenzoate synthetase / 4-amino-4-deoxychorismate lyase [Sphingomonas sp. NFR04]